jgi:Tat protein secretion system quality control protein TatD with DNase activity
MENNEYRDGVIREIGLYDAHCHPTDILASIKDIATMKARVLAVMSTRSQDQELVRNAARQYHLDNPEDTLTHGFAKTFVVPAFGWHPWFSHQLYNDLHTDVQPDQVEHYEAVLVPKPQDEEFMRALPAPRSLRQFLKETEARLREFPFALVGEVGLDRSFRLPEGPSAMTGDMKLKTGGSEESFTPGTREGRPLSPYRVDMEHQKTILRAQFDLAGRLLRPVSVHSVQAHGLVFELMQSLWKGHEKPSKAQMKRNKDAANAHAVEEARRDAHQVQSLPYPPRICMHSYSGPPEALKQFLAHSVPADVYFSFSTAINFSNTSTDKVESVIRAVPDDRILIESDLHCAGETMDRLLQEVLVKVCELKSWSLDQGAQQLKTNWATFVFGSGIAAGK